MNVLAKIKQRWQRRTWPRAAEAIQQGQPVGFTDKTKRFVKPVYAPDTYGICAIAISSGKKGERVQVVAREFPSYWIDKQHD